MVGKFNILVVDDEPDKRNLLTTAFEMAGYNVHTARDGVEGLAAVEAQQPDLIILDVMMPRMDGYEMARQIRSNSRTRFIPIIIQTASRHEAQDLRRGAEVGALGFITDPTDIDLLLARARTLLDFKGYLDTCEEAAFTDHLTGLSNRRRFERQLSREISRTERYTRPFCLLLIDVDRFKQVNDTYGHTVGDETLRRLAQVLQAGTRGIDTAARVGGEEFAVILPETEMHSGRDVAERLRQAISEMEVPGVGQITASIGIAEFPYSTPNGNDLYDAADTALYEAKNRGRNLVVIAAQNGQKVTSYVDNEKEGQAVNESLTHIRAS